MKVGDLIKLHSSTCTAWGLLTGVALLIQKLPRNDRLEYDWRVLVEGRCFKVGRQLEDSSELLSASR